MAPFDVPDDDIMRAAEQAASLGRGYRASVRRAVVAAVPLIREALLRELHLDNHRVLIIENGDDWRALNVPEDWDLDDVDRYLNGMAYGRAAVLTVADIADVEPSPDSFLPADGGEYGGGSI